MSGRAIKMKGRYGIETVLGTTHRYGGNKIKINSAIKMSPWGKPEGKMSNCVSYPELPDYHVMTSPLTPISVFLPNVFLSLLMEKKGKSIKIYIISSQLI